MQTIAIADCKLNVCEAAQFLGLSKSTLDKLRVRGDGPAYYKLGRRISYDRTDLTVWANRHKRRNTSENA